MSSVNPPGQADAFHRPPLTYPGNKAELAPEIIARIPPHETYVEPFGGTAGILFRKKRSRNEVINDLNSDLTTFMVALRDEVHALVDYLRTTPYSEEEYQRVKSQWRDGIRPDDDVVQAAQLFLLRRASFGADIGGFRATACGRKNSARQFSNARERLFELSDRLDEVVIHNKDWRTIVEKYAHPDAFMYLDPPYRGKQQYYDCEYDPILFENFWICQFDGSPNATESEHYPGEGPPAFLEQSVFEDTDADHQYGTAGNPFPVMFSSHGPMEALEPYTWNLSLPFTHEVNNRGGAKTVNETLTMNYDPFADDFQPFIGDTQQSLATF
jgi:DNA adenine methylase